MLDQTICIDESPFRDGWSVPEAANAETVRFWTTRLVYLATTYQQHRLAVEEYEHRKTAPEGCQEARKAHKIAENDYECPKARFLVFSLNSFGLGVNLKTGGIMALRTAIATDRMLLFVNGQQNVTKFQQRWQLVSCDRGDFQCFFLPPTPCVPTEEELQNAMGTKAINGLLKSRGNVTNYMEDHRVVVYPKKTPQKEPRAFRPRLVELCHELIAMGVVPDTPVVHKAIARILAPDPNPVKSCEADFEIGAALLLYMMRPRNEFMQELQKIQESITKQHDEEPRPSLGLPIRASDKCKAESECFSFEKYLHASQSLWLHKWPNAAEEQKVLPIMVTTESPSVSAEEEAFTKRRKPPHWQKLQFSFMHNNFDVQQDSGHMVKAANQAGFDEIMVSSLSSMRAQLSNRVVLLNCCSNFHFLINMLVTGGCGRRWDSEAVCLIRHPDEQFRLCCQWSAAATCQAKREQKQNQTATK